MKQSPAPTTSTSLSAALSTARSTALSTARSGLTVAAGLCLAATLASGAAAAVAPTAGLVHVSSDHPALTLSAGQGSGVVVAGGFEWGSNRSR